MHPRRIPRTCGSSCRKRAGYRRRCRNHRRSHTPTSTCSSRRSSCRRDRVSHRAGNRHTCPWRYRRPAWQPGNLNRPCTSSRSLLLLPSRPRCRPCLTPQRCHHSPPRRHCRPCPRAVAHCWKTSRSRQPTPAAPGNRGPLHQQRTSAERAMESWSPRNSPAVPEPDFERTRQARAGSRAPSVTVPARMLRSPPCRETGTRACPKEQRSPPTPVLALSSRSPCSPSSLRPGR